MASLREIERQSIWQFVAEQSRFYDGRRVLDHGCGQSPYREIIVGAGGYYYGIDRPEFPGSVVAEPVRISADLPIDILAEEYRREYRRLHNARRRARESGDEARIAEAEAAFGAVGPSPRPRGRPPTSDHFDTILSTQVIQYVPDPPRFLRTLRRHLVPGGVLVMTGPTNWPIVEREDLWRFTPAGIRTLAIEAGFGSVLVVPRADARFEGASWLLGWGMVAHRHR